MEKSSSQNLNGKTPKIVILRWGHRLQRDARLTTHVALTARALCASGFILADIEDKSIQQTVEKLTGHWGGEFAFRMGTSWKSEVRQWHDEGGIVVHLTVYGENIQSSDVLNRIKAQNKPIMVLVGSQKVPGEFYSSEVSDFNVAVGNQPHSECSALAIFLDRFFEGKELAVKYDDAEMGVVPQTRGKKIRS
ncbi:MAG: tRNA (cytidine(56)-2'-O)-methyltransferase [Candidatus Bathyarchaeota archaeon]|nr:tRNA (cytidine(56)-2'-O)-methyltransferase [Candidatus Bathyarchaeota archaeon]